MGFLFTDQELQRLKIGMKSLLAANDEKVSYRESGKHILSLWSAQLYAFSSVEQHAATTL